MIVNATDLKASLGKYLKAIESEDVIITKNGKPAALLSKLTSWEDAGILREGVPDYSYDAMNMLYEDFMKMNEETEGRYEYIGGKVYVLASPSYQHQKIIMSLAIHLTSYFQGKPCEPCVAPLDVHLTLEDEKAVVQPDLFVMCDKENIQDDKYYGVPSLVVEVLSPSSRSKDMIEKLSLYLRAGVQEYIAVDIKNKCILQWVFIDGEIDRCESIKQEEMYTSHFFEGLTLDIKSLFDF